jgi:hypothetical protein
MHSLIGHLDMQGILVGVGIDGHRSDAHLLRRLDNPTGDFPTIGNQYFLEHLNLGQKFQGDFCNVLIKASWAFLRYICH